ncbi:hypothetical protein B566_EDAN009027, partial [Ephemera danica]
GETIKQINQQTGAHCELDRRPPPSPNEKVFVIRGGMDQIEHAKRLINEKIGMSQGPGGNPQATQYPIGQGQGGQQPQPQFAPQGWGNAYQPWQNPNPNDPRGVTVCSRGVLVDAGPVSVNPQTGQPDYSMQWAEYYRSLGMLREAEMIEQQAKAQKGMQPQPAQQQAPQAGPQPGGVAQNGAPDYSLQWAEYYRSVGKIKEAEAIEAQIKMNKAGQPGGGGPPQQQQGPGGPAGGAPASQVPGGQAYQAYGYAAAGYYGGQGQPPAQNQAYSYPGYGGYGGQPQGPDNQRAMSSTGRATDHTYYQLACVAVSKHESFNCIIDDYKLVAYYTHMVRKVSIHDDNEVACGMLHPVNVGCTESQLLATRPQHLSTKNITFSNFLV